MSMTTIEPYRLDALVTGNQTKHPQDNNYEINGRKGWKTSEVWFEDPEPIGQGGFGEVFIQRTADRRVRAIKKVRKDLQSVPGYNCLREISFMALFRDHKYFPTFFGWFEDANKLYIAMEYFQLGDLSQFLHQKYDQQPVSEGDAMCIIAQVTRSLQVLHGQGITHRDVKPENIFVCQGGPQWWVKLGDFGISKNVDNNRTTLHTAFGGSHYIAPEIHDMDDSCSYTSAVDIWSLGCVLFWLTTRKSPRSLWSRVFRGQSITIKDIEMTHLSMASLEMLQQCLSLDPEHRPRPARLLESAQQIIASFGQDIKPQPLEPADNSQDETDETQISKSTLMEDMKTQARSMDSDGQVSDRDEQANAKIDSEEGMLPDTSLKIHNDPLTEDLDSSQEIVCMASSNLPSPEDKHLKWGQRLVFWALIDKDQQRSYLCFAPPFHGLLGASSKVEIPKATWDATPPRVRMMCPSPRVLDSVVLATDTDVLIYPAPESAARSSRPRIKYIYRGNKVISSMAWDSELKSRLYVAIAQNLIAIDVESAPCRPLSIWECGDEITDIATHEDRPGQILAVTDGGKSHLFKVGTNPRVLYENPRGNGFALASFHPSDKDIVVLVDFHGSVFMRRVRSVRDSMTIRLYNYYYSARQPEKLLWNDSFLEAVVPKCCRLWNCSPNLREAYQEWELPQLFPGDTPLTLEWMRDKPYILVCRGRYTQNSYSAINLGRIPMIRPRKPAPLPALDFSLDEHSR